MNVGWIIFGVSVGCTTGFGVFGVFGLLEPFGGGGGGGGGAAALMNVTVSSGGCTSSTWKIE